MHCLNDCSDVLDKDRSLQFFVIYVIERIVSYGESALLIPEVSFLLDLVGVD